MILLSNSTRISSSIYITLLFVVVAECVCVCVCISAL